MDENTLQLSLQTYQNQLAQVTAALQASGTTGNDDLIKLQEDLFELVQLTEESLLSLKKSLLLSRLETSSSSSQGTSKPQRSPNGTDNMDAEFAAFQAAIADSDDTHAIVEDVDKYKGYQREDDLDRGDSELTGDPVVQDDYTDPSLDGITGTQCRIPYCHAWGERRHHNAMIMAVEPFEPDEEPKVRVLFCHPTHSSMLPCKFFLDGRCRFTNEECRFSHGHVILVSELQEYEEPDYSALVLDTGCLAKDEDGVWYPGTVVDVLDDHQYKVMFDTTHSVISVSIEDIIPSAVEEASSEESEASSPAESDEEEEELPVYLWRPGQMGGMGEWEAHTKGIGSKLMSKMGYVPGQGLGRNGEGRAEPVPIQLLPSGKSLDKIMELKMLAGDRDLYDVMKRQKKTQKKVDEKACGSYNKVKIEDKKNVFDFINKKLHGKKGDINTLVKSNVQKKDDVTHINSTDLHERSDKHINIQLLKTHDEIKKTEKEMLRLKQGILRNEGKDRAMVKQLQVKLSSAEKYIQQLKSSEHSMEKHKKVRSDKKKLTIF